MHDKQCTHTHTEIEREREGEREGGKIAAEGTVESMWGPVSEVTEPDVVQ